MASLQRTLGAVYEEFQPKLELTETPEAHILHVHIPGFTRDQVKIRYVGSNKTLSISGEKLEGDNKWSRFSEAIPVPVNCEVNRLGAKFDKGILHITMPKKFITPVVPKDELKTSEEEMYEDPSLAAAYEEFQPKVEKTENLDAYLLHVYLPGFSKDQVKIKYISSSRMINISGERPIEGGKRWSRFDQAFPAPENFNEERLGAKFDQGILIITMPKKFTSFVAPKQEVAMAEPKPQRAEEEIPPKPMTDVEGLKRSSLLNLEEFDQKASTGDIYEEFQPKSEITESPEEYRLTIHLPGFTKNQVRIKYISFSRVISISGERSIEGGRRWSRFDQTFPVPENFNEERLGARFDQGTLTITMPKKITSLAAQKEEATMTEQKPQRAAEEIPSKPMTGVEGLRRSGSLLSSEEIDQKSSTDAVYEEFQPKSEVTESPEAYRLQIHLPGFTRDQVKIKYISSSRVMSISGERPIEGGRRWSRFDQTFPVPENFNEERLGARFDQGILTITMPKKFTSHVASIDDVAMAEPKPRRAEEVVPPKAMNGVEGLRRSSSLLSLEEIDKISSIGAVYEEFHPKSEITENLEAYHLHIHLPGFTRDQVKIKYISTSKVMSVSGERPIEGGNKWIRVDQIYPVPENCHAERVRGKFDRGILTLTMPKKSIPQMGKEGLVPKPTSLSLLDEHAAPRTASAEAKRIEEIVDTIGKGFQEVAASASNAVTNIGDGTLNNEEKHLLSVVIAALGAYVSHRLSASGKPYNY
ncbi:hypothetical protein L6164_023296 [Bauhinia variegata]|uniref:Uncharacterized protein n=1 Tax=Bauhinia variegata TaxID=167791 RepID=A0ACB9MJ60_BAUVA|nr:hypothetical protein L6164_023296 [Bauhinia variegata]